MKLNLLRLHEGEETARNPEYVEANQIEFRVSVAVVTDSVYE